jgi:hypothetical protein
VDPFGTRSWRIGEGDRRAVAADRRLAGGHDRGGFFAARWGERVGAAEVVGAHQWMTPSVEAFERNGDRLLDGARPRLLLSSV